MNSTFEFIGKLAACKESDKFKPYGTTAFPNSDWGKKFIKFNAVCGTNRHLMEVSDLVNIKNPQGMTIYTFSRGGTLDDGTKVKGEKMEVKFKDRNNPEIIEQVANFKKWVIDTEIPGRRSQLETAIDKFKEGTITTEQMDSIGVHSISECQAALEASNQKKKEFISAYDFIDELNKVVNDSTYKDATFKITGNYELDYDEKNDRWYRHFSVQRVYRVADDTEVASHATFGVVFGKDCIDDSAFDETGKYRVECYIPQYLNKYKKTFFAPMTITINGAGDDKEKKKAKVFAKKFEFPDNDDSEYRELGIVCDVLDGAQKVELTEDMLTEEQRENLEFGLCTMEDIIREMGGDVYGDRVTDIVMVKLARNYSNGSQPTTYQESDFSKPHLENDTDDDEVFSDDEI